MDDLDVKFKSYRDIIAFVVMNIAAPPFGLLIGYVAADWYGMLGSLVIFYVSYRLWKYYSGYSGRLSFAPKFKWNGK